MSSTETHTQTDVDLDFPSLWGVRVLNDDFTPMDFVAMIMMRFFGLDSEAAMEATMAIHEQGEKVVGAYPKEIAVTKAGRAVSCARSYGHPLRLEPIEV